MIETICPGIAIADNRYNIIFGNSRVGPIVEAIEELLKEGKEINDLHDLLEKVKERFKYHNIDPEKPHRGSN